MLLVQTVQISHFVQSLQKLIPTIVDDLFGRGKLKREEIDEGVYLTELNREAFLIRFYMKGRKGRKKHPRERYIYMYIHRGFITTRRARRPEKPINRTIIYFFSTDDDDGQDEGESEAVGSNG